MYQRFFGLRESPFNVNPDPRYLFQTRQIQESLAGLTYGIQNRKGFILLTGEVGTGKTTLLNRLSSRFPRSHAKKAWCSCGSISGCLNAIVRVKLPYSSSTKLRISRFKCSRRFGS
jgi:type II secretory pathway predicted ATPase ExeA